MSNNEEKKIQHNENFSYEAIVLARYKAGARECNVEKLTFAIAAAGGLLVLAKKATRY